MTATTENATAGKTGATPRLSERVRRIVHEGNERHITIRSRTGDVIVDVPLTLGVVGAAVAPVVVAAGALGALATKHSIAIERPSRSRLRHDLEACFAAVGDLIAAAGAEDWPRPTPCPKWNVGDLVSHMVGGIESFGWALADQPFSDERKLAPADDPAALYRTASQDVLRRLNDPGAFERMHEPPWGPTSGLQLVGFALIETIVHGWDLAVATGRPLAISERAIIAALAVSEESVDASMRTPEFFGPPIEVDRRASPLDRLVALLGRDPSWRKNGAR